jgi:predicted HNH restriction endonuclease
MENYSFTTEQMQADNDFVNTLNKSISDWEAELVFLEKELLEQALIDAKTIGTQSNRYKVLEAREADVKRYLTEGRTKLGHIANRYDVGPLKGLLTNALNNLRK